jgi:hypothetical protein
MKSTRWDMTIYCSDPKARHRPAKYKIAAAWTGGDYSELKTYGFADDECVVDVFKAALDRLTKFRSSEGETVGELHIYLLDNKRSDAALEHASEVEKMVRAKLGSRNAG